MPKVSVIVPNFNHAAFLRQRMDSILGQTFQDFEIILLDDASTDHSRDVLAEYVNRDNVRLFCNPVNSGSTFVQWNRGVQEAHGDYVWIAESDDYAAPDLLEKMVSCLDAHPNVGVAYCQSRIVDERGREEGVNGEYYRYLDPRRWHDDFINDGKLECARYHIFRNTIPNASAAVFRRSAYMAAGWADTRMRLAGDWLQWSRILMRSDVAYLASPMNYYRRHSGTVRREVMSTPQALKECIAVTGFIRKHCSVPGEVRRTVNEQWIHGWREMWLGRPRPSVKASASVLWSMLEADPCVFPQWIRTVFRARAGRPRPHEVG